MTSIQIVGLVLSSSLLSALLSAIANHFLASVQYRRDYHREVILRRLAAYELVQQAIGLFRGSTYDEHGRTAHLVFTSPENFHTATTAIARAVSHSLWLERDTRDHLVALNRMLLQIDEDEPAEEMFAGGAAMYEAIGRQREDLEACAARNLQTLHKVDRFLRAKQTDAESAPGPQVISVPRPRSGEA